MAAFCRSWPPEEQPELLLLKDFREVVAATEHARVAAVDMPIGLSSGAPRICDQSARELLPKNAGKRVFLSPPRPCLRADNPREFRDLHYRLTKRKADFAAWWLAPKLREVDAAMTPELQSRILEAHPELAWIATATGRVPDGSFALASKHRPEGIAQRLESLNRFLPEPLDEQTINDHGPAKADDVLDALVLLSAASRAAPIENFDAEQAFRVPRTAPPRDERGLRMEIFF